MSPEEPTAYVQNITVLIDLTVLGNRSQPVKVLFFFAFDLQPTVQLKALKISDNVFFSFNVTTPSYVSRVCSVDSPQNQLSAYHFVCSLKNMYFPEE